MAVVVVVMLDITPGDIQYVDGEFSAFRDSSSSNYFGLVCWLVGGGSGVRQLFAQENDVRCLWLLICALHPCLVFASLLLRAIQEEAGENENGS